ncbi:MULTISPECIES: hypothetical protein [Pseudoalteromonas]|uniref:hypothetical protein n=1 Tax=Pseudoalteromonas TaxID=53246 RepID=UPI0006BB253E|nr:MULTISPECIES: hypothetical protein [Pseudoalteromonas]KPH91671.1 hypothetical protein AMS57_06170 [Pseudoalteromonas undina]MCK8121062.1 hypothetical protein [Pseudoalteromonas sp. 2CM32C]
MDFILATLYVFLPIALARSSLNLKHEYQSKVEIFDEKFRVQFSKLTKLKTVEGADYLGNVMGLACGILIIVSLISNVVFGVKLAQNAIVAKALLFSMFGFVATKWYTKPHKYSLSFLKDMAQMASLVMLMPLIDLFLGIEYTSIPYEHMRSLLALEGINLPVKPNIFIMGIVVSLSMFIFFSIMWLFASVFLGFFFIPAFTTCFFVLKACSVLEKYWGKHTLNGLLVILIIATQYYSWFKN